MFFFFIISNSGSYTDLRAPRTSVGIFLQAALTCQSHSASTSLFLIFHFPPRDNDPFPSGSHLIPTAVPQCEKRINVCSYSAGYEYWTESHHFDASIVRNVHLDFIELPHLLNACRKPAVISRCLWVNLFAKLNYFPFLCHHSITYPKSHPLKSLKQSWGCSSRFSFPLSSPGNVNCSEVELYRFNKGSKGFKRCCLLLQGSASTGIHLK